MMPNLKAQTLLPRWTKGRDWLGRALGGRHQQILPEAPRVYLRPWLGHVWLPWCFGPSQSMLQSSSHWTASKQSISIPNQVHQSRRRPLS